jgi:OmpA-OmpF porin, OOP family
MKSFYILLIAAVAAITSGCTASGPLHNTDTVTLPNGAHALRVQCQGLLEGSSVCMSEAHKLCGDKAVQLIGAVTRGVDGSAPDASAREITFVCAVPVQPVVQQPAPQPVAKPVPAPVPVAVRKILLQGDANFTTGSAVLTPIAQQRLDQFIEANRGADLGRVVINGYTDSTGNAASNMRLSDARARSVQQYLVSHAVRATSYDVRGFGSAGPVASNATVAGRALNRRVEVQVAGQ